MQIEGFLGTLLVICVVSEANRTPAGVGTLPARG